MKTNINKKNTFTRELSVIVPWASLENDFKKEFDSQKRKYKIAGFRPGKVPNDIVKKNIGPAIEANFAELSLSYSFLSINAESIYTLPESNYVRYSSKTFQAYQ